MADNGLNLEEGAVYLYASPGLPAELMICHELVLTGWFNEINTSWEFDPKEGGTFNVKYLRKIAPSVQALVEQVVPFSFGVF